MNAPTILRISWDTPSTLAALSSLLTGVVVREILAAIRVALGARRGT
jgi:hypothetical protein